MACALCMNIESISVGHVGQAQPEGRTRAGPGDSRHAGGGLTPAAKHKEEGGGGGQPG